MENELLRENSDLILLSILSRGDACGYELSRELSRLSGGAYGLREITLYAALARLERQGLLSDYAGPESGGRSRTFFALTERGRESLLERRRQWTEAVNVMRCFIHDDEGRTGTASE